MPTEIIKNSNDRNFEYIPLSEAGKILNTSRDYMNVLVRRGKLHAIKLGRNWVTTKEWLNEYQKSVGRAYSESDSQISSESDSALAKAEKEELQSLKSGLILERERALQAKALTPEITLSSRALKTEERKNILETVKKQFKVIDVSEFQKVSKRLGILKSLKSWSNFKLSLASAFTIVFIIFSLASALGVTRYFNVSRFQDLKISLLHQDYGGQAKFKDFNISKYKAFILSDVFKNFPSDIPFFYKWLADSVSRSLAFLKFKMPSELAISELPGGESKIAKPQETFARIDTLDEALALDALGPGLPSEALAKEGEETFGDGVSTSAFTLIENRLSVVEADLAEQKALTNAELSLQKKTILGTLGTLIGISKLLPTYPISTIVVQGQPATLTTYSIQPSVHSGFDRLSASYLNLSNNAEINGSLTVKSGGTFNTLSVSGATSLTGNTTISGTLNVAGDSTLGNLTVNGTLSVPGSISLGSASSTYLTISDTAWINKLNVTNTTSTSTITGGLTIGNNGALVVNSGSTANSLYIAGNGNVGIGTSTPGNLLSVHSTGNVYFGGALTVSGQTTLTNASTSILTAPTFFSTNGQITNASTTYAT
ncbi:MAG: hypothetical protein Q7R61_01900, partial [bacterium]|nr:hypothetical protein [bacterium]